MRYQLVREFIGRALREQGSAEVWVPQSPAAPATTPTNGPVPPPGVAEASSSGQRGPEGQPVE